MLKKTITYVDYDDNERTETFYFNLNKAELVELQMSEAGGMKQMLEDIIAAKDTVQIMAFFKRFIKLSYGKKSPDGRRLMKSDELSNEFFQTEAYPVLIEELLSNSDQAAKFVEAVLPRDSQTSTNVIPMA